MIASRKFHRGETTVIATPLKDGQWCLTIIDGRNTAGAIIPPDAVKHLFTPVEKD